MLEKYGLEEEIFPMNQLDYCEMASEMTTYLASNKKTSIMNMFLSPIKTMVPSQIMLSGGKYIDTPFQEFSARVMSTDVNSKSHISSPSFTPLKSSLKSSLKIAPKTVSFTPETVSPLGSKRIIKETKFTSQFNKLTSKLGLLPIDDHGDGKLVIYIKSIRQFTKLICYRIFRQKVRLLLTATNGSIFYLQRRTIFGEFSIIIRDCRPNDTGGLGSPKGKTFY